MIYYTDGAVSNNGSTEAKGGWAWIAVENDNIVKKQSGAIKGATNNYCELTAVLKACQDCDLSKDNSIYSDSAYIINCYKNKWYQKWRLNGWKNSKKESVANRELWEQIIPFFESDSISFFYVKGHDKNLWNNIVDALAVGEKE